ncbi:uncharacterized protein METZ01_LOCUS329831 [marine metagenome]|uniref:Uncharacterized protein n=1 Tax=marine metagenome TaxID=408172 RepID=A0A382PVT9_9ZZZZ
MSSQAISQNIAEGNNQELQVTQIENNEVSEEELEKLKAIYEKEILEEQELEEENIVDTSEAMVFMSNT